MIAYWEDQERGERCCSCGERTDRQVIVETVEGARRPIYRYCSVTCARPRHTDLAARFDELDAQSMRRAAYHASRQLAAHERREAAARLRAANREAVIRLLPEPPTAAAREWDLLTQESRKLNGRGR